jgi:DNA-binding response OmpR family regulator
LAGADHQTFALPETLMRHPGQVLDRLQLLDHVWHGGRA